MLVNFQFRQRLSNHISSRNVFVHPKNWFQTMFSYPFLESWNNSLIPLTISSSIFRFTAVNVPLNTKMCTTFMTILEKRIHVLLMKTVTITGSASNKDHFLQEERLIGKHSSLLKMCDLLDALTAVKTQSYSKNDQGSFCK